jgi:hypothetical protein
MKVTYVAPGADFGRNVMPHSKMLFQNSTRVNMDVTVTYGSVLNGELPELHARDTDLFTKSTVNAAIPGAVTGFTGVLHTGKERDSWRRRVAVEALTTVGELGPAVSSNSTTPSAPAISTSTRRVAVTKSGTPKTKRPVREREVNL